MDDAMMNEMNPDVRYLKETLSMVKDDKVHHGMDDIIPRNMFVSTDRHKKLDAMSLAENWGIGPIRAKATLLATTQQFMRSAILPIIRRYMADRFFNAKRLDGKFSTDTLWGDVKSLNQHRYV